MSNVYPTRIYDDNVISVLQKSEKKPTYKAFEKYIKKFRKLMKQKVKEREEVIETIEYYMVNEYVHVDMVTPLELMGEKELLDLLDKIISITRKLI